MEIRPEPSEALNGQLRALWNSLYPDRAAKQVDADGFPVIDDLLARLSPLQFDHINFLGRYAFFRPQEASRRPLRAPLTGEEDDDGRREGRRRAAGGSTTGGRRVDHATEGLRGWSPLRRPRPDGDGISGGPRRKRTVPGPTLQGMNFTSGKAVLGPSSRCPPRCRRCRSKNASG
ncbi:Tn3 family transposase [Streptomyces mirabilis]|uniref:Tn3 family transposase n=1 Tax=Streptomyces mirabilis TaxID=68239 RepID=UPI00369BBDD2